MLMLTLLGVVLYRVANGSWREAETLIAVLVATVILDTFSISFLIWWLQP